MKFLISIAVLFLVGSCFSEKPNSPKKTRDSDGNIAEPSWKRGHSFNLDLQRVLNLSDTELCEEVGSFSCDKTVHLVPLGGNEPFEKLQWIPPKHIMQTTPISFKMPLLKSRFKFVCSTNGRISPQCQ